MSASPRSNSQREYQYPGNSCTIITPDEEPPRIPSRSNPMAASPDAIVIGAGPNGLSAAIALARAGRKVIVFEAMGTVGGGASSAPLTLPGFVHDVCSAVHPFAVGVAVLAHAAARRLRAGVGPASGDCGASARRCAPAAIAWRSLENGRRPRR